MDKGARLAKTADKSPHVAGKTAGPPQHLTAWPFNLCVRELHHGAAGAGPTGGGSASVIVVLLLGVSAVASWLPLPVWARGAVATAAALALFLVLWPRDAGNAPLEPTGDSEPANDTMADRVFIQGLVHAVEERRDGNLMAEIPVSDVPELKALSGLIEQLLKESEHSEDGVQSMEMPMVAVAETGKIVVANQAAVRLFGYQNQGELVLEDIQVLLPNEGDRAWILRDPGEADGLAQRESLGLRASGNAFPVDMEVVERSDRHTMLHLTDITSQKEIEAAMQKARDTALHTAELQAQFLANMSHEIRTPVNGILGMAQLLLDSEDVQGEARENAQIIHSSGESLLTIINDILDLTKLDSGKVALDPQETNLRRLAQEAITLLEPKADERGNSLELDYPIHHAIPRYASVDPVRLRQILLNLLSNAVKFTENGSVCTRVRYRQPTDAEPGGMFVFEVEDTGIGIAPEKLEHIFERFVQAEASTTRKYGGTGLGLSVTKQLSELMGGTIEVDSSNYGTIFRVSLPLPLCQPRRLTEPAPGAARAPSMEGLRVLVAEDNPVNQKITSRMLGKMGCVVTVVENGEDAAKEALSGEFDLVLMDCMMPQVDGYEGTRRIRAAEGDTGGHIPVIALTARAMEGDREQCMQAGMDDYLTKPFSVAGLQGMMARWLEEIERTRGAVAKAS